MCEHNCEMNLEEPCWSCSDTYGTKRSTPPLMVDDNGKCSLCKGAGFRMTDRGEVVAEFIERWFGVKRLPWT